MPGVPLHVRLPGGQQILRFAPGAIIGQCSEPFIAFGFQQTSGGPPVAQPASELRAFAPVGVSGRTIWHEANCS